MKIAIDKETQLAYYKGDLEMKDYLHGHDFIDTRMTPANCELIDIAEIPIKHWIGGGRLKFNGIGFDLTSEGETEILFNLKKAKRANIKTSRDEALNDQCTVTISAVEYTLDCDLVSRSSIHQALDNAEMAGMPDTDTISWKLYDNTHHDFAYADLRMVALQMAMFVQAQYNNERDKSIAIDNADINTIENVVW